MNRKDVNINMANNHHMNGPASRNNSNNHLINMPSPILGIPRIVITDMDEDPEVKKAERLSEMIDWSALFIMIFLIWCQAFTRLCFATGCVIATICSSIAATQFIIMIKTSYSAQMGNTKYKPPPEYQTPMSMRIRAFRNRIPFLAESEESVVKTVKKHDDEYVPRMLKLS